MKHFARMTKESVDEAIGKLGPNASREDKIKHTMKIMKKYPANKGKSEKQLRKGATDYIDQFTNKNKRDDAYIAKMKAKKESVEDVTEAQILTKAARRRKADSKKAAKTYKDIRKGKYPGVKMANEADDDKRDNDPCWDSHKMVGMKKKNGKEVPNCVPK
jgi:ABC-type proline/glycine betaine transport system ATPase subunit